MCGGCDWQHLAYAEQLARKQARLTELLRASLGHDAPRVEPPIGMAVDDTGSPWQFRQKAAFVFGDGPDRMAVIGHHAAGSRRVVAIDECPVHADRANRLALALHGHLVRARIPAAGPSLRGILRHLIVRTTRDGREAAAMLVVTRNDKALRRPLRAFLDTEDAPDGFYLNVHDKPGPFMVGPDTMRLAGRSHVRERVGGVSFLLSPTTFFQTNIEAAEILVRIALETIAATAGHILDLYAGSGLFTLPLAARGHRVTAVEENAQAMKDADSNRRLNRIAPGDVRLVTATAEAALQRFGQESFDQAILDPPRSGCSARVLHALFTGLRPARVLYVSCNPDALASELPAILEAGYRIARVQPVDMFPHTTHIEALVTLDRTARRRATAPAPLTRSAERHLQVLADPRRNLRAAPGLDDAFVERRGGADALEQRVGERPLGERKRGGRYPRHLAGNLLGTLQQRVGSHDLVDEPDAGGIRRQERAAGDHELAEDVPADPGGHDFERERRKRHPDDELGHADAAGAGRHHAMVAGRRDDAAAGDRMPVHGGHDGLGEGDQRAEKRVQRRQEPGQIGTAAVQHAEQIDARGERRPGAGHHQRPSGTAHDLVQRRDHRVAELTVERAHLAVRHAHDGDRARILAADHA